MASDKNEKPKQFFSLAPTWTKNSLRLAGKAFSPLIQNRSKNYGSGATERKLLSLKILIHDVREQNTVFPLNSIRCRHRHWCYKYRRRSTTKIKVFASVRNSHRTWLWTRRRKTNADLRFPMNKIIRSMSALQVANIGIDVISTSFKFSNDCLIKSTETLMVIQLWYCMPWMLFSQFV